MDWNVYHLRSPPVFRDLKEAAQTTAVQKSSTELTEDAQSIPALHFVTSSSSPETACRYCHRTYAGCE